MMMKIFLACCGLLYGFKPFAQDQLVISYLVKFNDEFDRGRKDRLYEAVLQISNGRSKYFMVSKESFQPLDDNDARFMPDTAQVVFTSQANGVMISQEYGLDGKALFVSDSLYPMIWEILPDEKMIDSMNCVKARCHFRGREYTAWFVPDIPLPLGPWKMGGLPGLIVDLQDSGENLVIQLQQIQRKPSQISLPTKVRYTMEEHVRDLKLFLRRLQQGARADQSGNCLTCTGHTTYQVYFWEKLSQ